MPSAGLAFGVLILLAITFLGFVIPYEGEDNPHTRLTNEAIKPALQNSSNMPVKTVNKNYVSTGDLTWTSGMASGYDLEDNDGWDATASGIPLDRETYTVAVPEEQSYLLLRYVEILYEDMIVTAQVTDTGGFSPYGRDLDLAPAVWMAFGAPTGDEWGVREVQYRYL